VKALSKPSDTINTRGCASPLLPKSFASEYQSDPDAANLPLLS
jgi:hypothetical protein